MTRLENNPLGMALLAVCAVLVLTGLALTVAWRGPGSLDSGDLPADADMDLPAMPQPLELGPLGDYDVVLNRPVFSDSRRPEIDAELAPEEAIVEEDFLAEVSDPPKVRLTGVVITPEEKLVTLTPVGGGEALVIREGMPLEGEFTGWSVDEVAPRSVRLASSNGERLDVELLVHDAMIDEPPEPEPRRTESEENAEGAAGEEEAAQDSMSRADQIRERIRQRREELRAEAGQADEDDAQGQEARTNAYQDAIRNLMYGRNRGNENNNEGQKGNDDSGGD